MLAAMHVVILQAIMRNQYDYSLLLNTCWKSGKNGKIWSQCVGRSRVTRHQSRMPRYRSVSYTSMIYGTSQKTSKNRYSRLLKRRIVKLSMTGSSRLSIILVVVQNLWWRFGSSPGTMDERNVPHLQQARID